MYIFYRILHYKIWYINMVHKKKSHLKIFDKFKNIFTNKEKPSIGINGDINHISSLLEYFEYNDLEVNKKKVNHRYMIMCYLLIKNLKHIYYKLLFINLHIL